MVRYRKKPVDVEAWQVGSDEPMPEWVTNVKYDGEGCRVSFFDGTFENVLRGDWLVIEKYKPIVLAPYYFEQDYEAVNDAED